MPVFAAIILNFFGAIAGWLAGFIAKKAALTVALGGVVVVLTLALFGLYKAVSALLLYSISNEYVLMVFNQIWPDNANLCIGSIIAAEVAAFVYRYKVKMLILLSLR